MNCLFCNIASGEITAPIVYQDDKVVAFNDIAPQAPHHVLIIPRKHIATINDLNSEDADLISHLVLTAKNIAAQLKCAKTGYRLMMNCNKDGGQTVYHIHLHVLAGRQMKWPPG